jgi:hypothetical protein
MKKTILLTFALFVALVGLSTLTGFAQKTIDIGKTGYFHLGSSLKVGNTLLKSGMYRVKHRKESSDHFIIFRKVAMNRYGRSMGNLKLDDGEVKIRGTVESVGKQNRHAKIVVGRNSVNKRKAVEIWFRNETVKYILPEG